MKPLFIMIIYLLLRNGVEALFPQLADIFQQELGWDKTKWQDEVTHYRAIWQQSYYLPKSIYNKPVKKL